MQFVVNGAEHGAGDAIVIVHWWGAQNPELLVICDAIHTGDH